MSAIVRYIIQMLPYIGIAFPVFVFIRIIRYKRSHTRVNWTREVLLAVFVLFVVGLASQAVIPRFGIGEEGVYLVRDRVHTTNLIPFKVFTETYHEVVNRGNMDYFIINFLGNIIMFMPIGFFIPLLWQRSGKQTVLIGFCFSLFIEVSQLFQLRGTDVDDLILNTLGVFLGWCIFFVMKMVIEGSASSGGCQNKDGF